MVRRLAPVVICALTVAACHRLPPPERGVVGTWYSWTMHGNVRHIFRPDHTLTIYMDFDDPKAAWATGSWHVEDNDLIVTYRIAGSPDTQRSDREKIREITSSRLTTNRNEYTRSKLYPDTPWHTPPDASPEPSN